MTASFSPLVSGVMNPAQKSLLFWRCLMQRMQTCISVCPTTVHHLCRALNFLMPEHWIPTRPLVENILSVHLSWDSFPRQLKKDVVHYIHVFDMNFAIVMNPMAPYVPHIPKGSYMESWAFMNLPDSPSIVMSLLDPQSGKRLVAPIRYKHCQHPECFEGFDENTLPHVCPICRAPRLDPYMDCTVQQMILQAPEKETQVILQRNLDFKFPKVYPCAADALARFQRVLEENPVDAPPGSLQTLHPLEINLELILDSAGYNPFQSPSAPHQCHS